MSKTNFWYILLFVGALLAAAGLRLNHLGERPFHGDEANQAIRTEILLEEGKYEYDPHEHHGPTLYFLELIPLKLLGIRSIEEATEADFRILTVFFGLFTVLLLLPLRNAMGRRAVTIAAVLTAVSPAMTYYSRYFIQEMLLVAFTMATIVFGWLYVERRSAIWAVLTGAMAGAMYATKETCVLALAAMVAAGGLTWLWQWRRTSTRPSLIPWKHVVFGLLAAFTMSFLFYSSFLTHPQGFLNSFLAYTHYAGRAQGQGSASLHDKPWYYYLALLCYTSRSIGPRWSEGFIVFLALCGIGSALFSKSPPGASTSFLHFRALYAVILTVLYSVIPYKTPWNVLPFYHGYIMIAGSGAAALLGLRQHLLWRLLVVTMITLGAAHLAWQSVRANGDYAADVSNPYVYAHTSTNLVRLAKRVDEIAAHAPDGKGLHINIIKPDADYWPLPWYLRAYNRVGYWTSIPPHPDAAIIIADPQSARDISPLLDGAYTTSTYSLRPNILLILFVRQDLWDAFMADRQ